MQVSTDTGHLRQEFEQAIASILGPRRLVRHVSRRRSRYSSSYTIHNLQVVLDQGERFSLVLKDLSPSALLEEARGVRPSFLYDPRREIEMYRTVLEHGHFGTPVFYGAVIRKDIERYWLFLERGALALASRRFTAMDERSPLAGTFPWSFCCSHERQIGFT